MSYCIKLLSATKKPLQGRARWNYLQSVQAYTISKNQTETQTGIEYFAISKDTSRNYIIAITIQELKRHYFFIYLKSKLVYVRVSEDVADKKIKWKNGYYYFQGDSLVHKEETEPNFVEIEEMKTLGETYLNKAKTH